MAEDAVNVVRAYQGALQTGDVEAAAAMLADDVVFTIPGRNRLSGVLCGQARSRRADAPTPGTSVRASYGHRSRHHSVDGPCRGALDDPGFRGWREHRCVRRNRVPRRRWQDRACLGGGGRPARGRPLLRVAGAAFRSDTRSVGAPSSRNMRRSTHFGNGEVARLYGPGSIAAGVRGWLSGRAVGSNATFEWSCSRGTRAPKRS